MNELTRLAHVASDGRKQTLSEHCRAVQELCAQSGKALGLEALASLIGLLHDLGKATSDFTAYLLLQQQISQAERYGLPLEKAILEQSNRVHHNHAATGAVYTFRRWKHSALAQTIAMTICGHHAGLYDCLDNHGESPFLTLMNTSDDELECEYRYTEAVSTFIAQVADEAELDELYQRAELELSAFAKGLKNAFDRGMLLRLLHSFLIDADRLDSAAFDYGEAVEPDAYHVDWASLLDVFDHYRAANFRQTSEIGKIRTEISDACMLHACREPGIFQLTVPTGGGKTLASLRFALAHAEANQLKKIFYVIPFNTILDQNAADIRTALGNYSGILEHHSNIVQEDEKSQLEWKRLTERWDSDIILTSLVQFLNALFRGENTAVRRMHQLAQSLIIFDEIQAMPKHCKVLFERGIQFLTNCCGCTVVLCTATQPELSLQPKPVELAGNVEELFRRLKRVEYVPALTPVLSYQEAAERIADFVIGGTSTLAIVNTKAAAREIFDKTGNLLRNAGVPLAEVSDDMESAIQRGAVLCVHLSTLMCAAHRKENIKCIKKWQQARGKILCVSTALIEAGINISFPVVIRSLAGLPSIIQAGGRCNRNKELDCGSVYIWRLFEENLGRLREIQWGQNVSDAIIRDADTDGDLASPVQISRYFQMEQQIIDEQPGNLKEYPCPLSDWDTTIVDLLSTNKKCKTLSRERARNVSGQLAYTQSFKHAGSMFQVIDQNTKSILVPYGEGKELISELLASSSQKGTTMLLRKLQAYAVNVYDNLFCRLSDCGAITIDDKYGIVILKEGYYSRDGGVTATQTELETMIY